ALYAEHDQQQQDEGDAAPERGAQAAPVGGALGLGVVRVVGAGQVHRARVAAEWGDARVGCRRGCAPSPLAGEGWDGGGRWRWRPVAPTPPLPRERGGSRTVGINEAGDR